jgi:hypothetical protein
MNPWFFALAAAAAIGSAASAQTAAAPDGAYRPLGVDDLGIQFIDDASLRKDGSSREFSMLVVFAHPKAVDKAEFLYATFRTRVDCAAWTQKGLFAIFHARDGADTRSDLRQPAASIRPGSPMEDAAKYACRDKPDPEDARTLPMSEKEAVRVAMGAFAASAPADPAAKPSYRTLVVNHDEIDFLDEGSVARDGAVRDYRLLMVWAKPRLGGDGKTEHPYAKFQGRVDCSARMTKLLSITTYSNSGPDRPILLSRAAEAITPGSLAAIAADDLCKGSADPALAQVRLVTEAEAVRAAEGTFAADRRRQEAGGK